MSGLQVVKCLDTQNEHCNTYAPNTVSILNVKMIQQKSTHFNLPEMYLNKTFIL